MGIANVAQRINHGGHHRTKHKANAQMGQRPIANGIHHDRASPRKHNGKGADKLS